MILKIIHVVPHAFAKAALWGFYSISKVVKFAFVD